MKITGLLLLAASLSATVLFTNCKKKAAAVAVNFSPSTTGSTWTYSNTPGTPFTLTATSKDTLIVSRTYRVFANNNGPNNYLAKIGNDYYRFGEVPLLGPNGLEELYLKDNLALNGIWSAQVPISVPGFPAVTATNTYTIKSTGGIRVVNGVTFNKVTYVRMDISLTLLGLVGGGDFYYADGVGLIQNSIIVNVPGQTPINQSQLLTSYSIK